MAGVGLVVTHPANLLPVASSWSVPTDRSLGLGERPPGRASQASRSQASQFHRPDLETTGLREVGQFPWCPDCEYMITPGLLAASGRNPREGLV